MKIARGLQTGVSVAVISALLGGPVSLGCSGRSASPPSEPAPAPSAAPLPALDGSVIADRLGAPVTSLAGGAVSATLPRAELSLRIEGAPAAAALGLSTDVVFRPAPAGVSIAGSTALLEDEVSPVLDTLLAHGIRVVGLYNRFLFDEPRVLVLRFEAEGQAALLASGVQSIAAAVRDARTRSAQPLRALPGDAPGPGSLDAVAIGGVLGAPARLQGATVIIDVPRVANPTPPTGAAGAASTAPARLLLTAALSGSDLRAALDGRLLIASAELVPVLSALRAGNVHLVGLVPQGVEGTTQWFTLFVRGKGTSLQLLHALDQAIHAVGAAPP
jgi:hypothetical protein